MYSPSGGSSHFIFRKTGCQPITIPKHEPIKKAYNYTHLFSYYCSGTLIAGLSLIVAAIINEKVNKEYE